MANSLKVYFWDWSEITEASLEKIQQQLTSSDLEKLRSISSEKRKAEYLTGRFLIRQSTEIMDPILFTESGKPYFEKGPCFSLSHSHKRSLLVVGDTDVGADIQFQNSKRSTDEIVKNYALPKEIQHYGSLNTDKEKTQYFFELWGLKESVCKAKGTGIDEDFRHIEITDYNPESQLTLYSFESDQFQYSICGSQSEDKPEYYNTRLEKSGLLSFHISPPTAEVKALSVLGR